MPRDPNHTSVTVVVLLVGVGSAAAEEEARLAGSAAPELTQLNDAHVDRPGTVFELPPGFEVVNITDDPGFDLWERMNECGQIIYSKRIDQTHDLLLYDNGRTIRVTTDDVDDRVPDINNAGRIVWSRHVGPVNQYGWPTGEIYLWMGEDFLRVTADYVEDNGPTINNLGHFAWSAETDSGGSEVMFHDLETIHPITSNGQSNKSIAINDQDEIVWVRHERGPGSISNIMLHRGGMTIPLTHHGDGVNPSINNVGLVASRVNRKGIDLWKNGKTRRLTGWGAWPDVNSRGDVAFHRWDEDSEATNAWYYSGQRFYQLTFSASDDIPHDINDASEVVWGSTTPDRQTKDIFYLRRIRNGDADFDADVDHADYAMLFDCMTGPGRVDRLCDCRFLDLDHDGDVDLRDYAEFQVVFPGSGDP